MATQAINQHSKVGEGVPMEGGNKQKKNGVAEGRNRKALGDIGNLVTVRGLEGKLPHRPVTRSFRAQLLANAQAAGGNQKKPDCAVLQWPLQAAGGKRPVAIKPAQKKVYVKPKAEEVIEISPDSKEVVKEVERPHKKKAEGGSSKKKTQTLTSKLTARSKAACGLTDKPKEQIVDIDSADYENELAAVEYVEDIYKFYKIIENESRASDYMESQPEINQKMREILVDWLIEVHNKFELMPETLFLTMNIIDRFLSVKSVPRKELQLVGMSAMLMASKYEEIWAPEVNDFVCISDRAYSHEQILKMEKVILGKLEWTLTVATPYVFLVRFIKAAIPDKEMENMVCFLAELGLMHYSSAILVCPSMLAASAVYAARCTLNKIPAWNATLKLHTGFSEAQVIDCARLLVTFHAQAPESRYKVIFRKYSDAKKGAVALLPPASLLPNTTTASVV